MAGEETEDSGLGEVVMLLDRALLGGSSAGSSDRNPGDTAELATELGL